MKKSLPEKIIILGHRYTVKVGDERKSGNADLGNHWGKESKIWVNNNQCQEMMESCLLHECLEAINYHLSLKLDHRTICRLETSLHQILKENPSWITKK